GGESANGGASQHRRGNTAGSHRRHGVCLLPADRCCHSNSQSETHHTHPSADVHVHAQQHTQRRHPERMPGEREREKEREEEREKEREGEKVIWEREIMTGGREGNREGEGRRERKTREKERRRERKERCVCRAAH